MPEVNRNLSTCTNPSQILLAFKPRQVLLTEQRTKATTMKKSKKSALNPDQKALLLRSVLRYLKCNGFSRALKRLLFEAQIEDDNWKACSLDLEDMYGKVLEMRPQDDKNNDPKDQEWLADGITKKDGDSRSSAFEQTVVEKKKKKSEIDATAAADESGAADKLNGMKGKKKSKQVVDSVSQAENTREQVSTETNVMDESPKKEKGKKKKKSKLTSESLDDSVEQAQLDSVEAVDNKKCKKLKPASGNDKSDSEVETKSNHKRKKKKSSTSEQCNSVLDNMHEVPLEEKKKETKYKKRRKEESVSDISVGVAEMPEKDTLKGKSESENIQNSENAVDKEKKSFKKRKRLASDENEGPPVDKIGSEESKRRKTELGETKHFEQLTEMNEAAQDDKHAEERENGFVAQNEFEKKSIKRFTEHATGKLEENGEKSAAQKTGGKQVNGSAEPKTVNAFQRVKIDKVEFADERLQDNSYWAKDGAGSGYGAKAQEILGQVKGRDFRHEKTKKKRGSYRGGQIDMQSHSVKFNYSDED